MRHYLLRIDTGGCDIKMGYHKSVRFVVLVPQMPIGALLKVTYCF